MQKQGKAYLTEQLAVLQQLFQVAAYGAEAIQCISVSTGCKKKYSGGHDESWERIWFEVI